MSTVLPYLSHSFSDQQDNDSEYQYIVAVANTTVCIYLIVTI